MKTRDPVDVVKARANYEETRRILRKAWVRATGSVEKLVMMQLEEVEEKIKQLNP
jgi:hypothetical protein